MLHNALRMLASIFFFLSASQNIFCSMDIENMYGFFARTEIMGKRPAVILRPHKFLCTDGPLCMMQFDYDIYKPHDHADTYIGKLTAEYYESERSIHILWLSIDKNYQNQGCGTQSLAAFMDFIEKFLAPHYPLAEFSLNVDHMQKHAQYIYHKLGFQRAQSMEATPFAMYLFLLMKRPVTLLHVMSQA